MRNDKAVIIAYIPEAQAHQKPIYIKSRGLPKGAFRRIASTDQHCTDEDIALFFQLRDHKSFDESPVSHTSLDDFDPNALTAYRRSRANLNPNAAELSYNDAELLDALDTPTNNFLVPPDRVKCSHEHPSPDYFS